MINHGFKKHVHEIKYNERIPKRAKPTLIRKVFVGIAEQSTRRARAMRSHSWREHYQKCCSACGGVARTERAKTINVMLGCAHGRKLL